MVLKALRRGSSNSSPARMRSAAWAGIATILVLFAVIAIVGVVLERPQAAPLLKRLRSSAADAGLLGVAFSSHRSIKYVGLQSDAGGSNRGSGVTTKPVTYLRLEGRFHRSNDALFFEWPHSAIRARFEGSAIAMRLELVRGEQDFYVVQLDKRPPFTLTVSRHQPLVQIAAGLPTGVAHEIAIIKRTESHQSTAKFMGFDPGAGGRLLEAPPPKERRIEVIGDSISAGFGNECSGIDDDERLKTQNAWMTYAAMAARAFDAELRLTASAGRGVTKNADQTVKKTMPLLWDKVLPDFQPSLQWRFSADWQPDVVVIALSTNDWFSTPPNAVQFQFQWMALLLRVRQVYPKAHIILPIGPMLTNEVGRQWLPCCLDTARRWIADMVQKVQLPDVSMVEFPSQTELGLPLGCTGHPTVAIHEIMAEHLKHAIAQAVGWRPVATSR